MIGDIGDIRRAPVTKGLEKQRVLNVQRDNLLSWWTRIIEAEKIGIPDAKTNEQGWPDIVNKNDLYSLYERYCMERHLPVEMMAVWSRRIINDLGVVATRVRIEGSKAHVYRIPSVKACRRVINESYKGLLSEIDEDVQEKETEI